MENKHFDKWEFQKALDLMESDPIEANFRFEEYLKKYKKDYSMWSYYATNLITLGQFDKAEQICEWLKGVRYSDEGFAKQADKVEVLKKNIVYNTLRLLAYREKYDEFYIYYLKNKKRLKDMDFNTVDFYFKKKVGGAKDAKKENINSYLFRQIVEYDKEEFLKHVERHQADYNKDLDDPNSSIFAVDFPLQEVLQEIEKYIPSEKTLYTGFFEDSYVFKYEGCGRANNKIVDYFKVVCFHNTKNIITMCPASKSENLPFIDLTYLIKREETPKRKQLSQIEKFNKRFNRR